MTKKQSPVLKIMTNEEFEAESLDRMGGHIKSPAFLPSKEWPLPAEGFSLPSAALSLSTGNGTNENGRSLANLGPKPSSPHKLSKHHKFPSMNNLLLAAEEEEEAEETAAQQHADEATAHTAHGHKDDSAPHHGLGEQRSEGSPKSGPVLDHTVGTTPSYNRMRRSQSVQELHVAEGSPLPAAASVPQSLVEEKIGRDLLFVLDMDHTMVGDLVALSDRDNIETNVEWTYWPEGRTRGLSVEDIIPYLERGMLRPGMLQLLEHLRSIGSTVVVYTHSEKKWASKVCAAMERVAGFNFIARLFSRQDCRDGHPTFLARKSLEFVVSQLHEEEGMRWSKVEQSVMFDDDINALSAGEQCRLIQVPSYDYWEPCQWNEVVTDELMEKNDMELTDMVRRSVVEWGIAQPSYINFGEERTEEEVTKDDKWAAQLKRKHQILLSFNKVAKLDRVMHNIREVLVGHPRFDPDALESLPVRLRAAIGDCQGTGRPGRRQTRKQL